MNLKTFVLIIIGVSTFLGVYLFSMIGALAILVGFGLGYVFHPFLYDIYKSYNRNIYLSEKADMAHRKKELESELEKLKQGD